MRQIPDISDYQLHRTVHDVDLEGLAIPGLTGRFYERPEGDRVATAGCYSLAEEEIFMAWGYRDEAHCAWTAYRLRDGWTTPHRGCPRPRSVHEAITRPAPCAAPAHETIARPGAEE